MTVSNKTFLERFLYKKQGERRMTREQVDHLFAALKQMEIAFAFSSQDSSDDLHRIDKNRFEAYLLSPDNGEIFPGTRDAELRFWVKN